MSRSGRSRPVAVASLMTALELYRRFISSRLPRVCIFHPSCSDYASLALDLHGIGKGIRLAWARMKRCQGGVFAGEDWPPGTPSEDRVTGVDLGPRILGENEYRVFRIRHPMEALRERSHVG